MVISRVEDPEDILQYKLQHDYLPAGLTQLWDDTVGLRDQLSLIEKTMDRLNEVWRVYNKKGDSTQDIIIDVSTDPELLSDLDEDFQPNYITATNAEEYDALALARLAVDLDQLTDAIETNALGRGKAAEGQQTALTEQIDFVIRGIAYIFADADEIEDLVADGDLASFDVASVIADLKAAVEGATGADGRADVDDFFDAIDIDKDEFIINVAFWQNDLVPNSTDPDADFDPPGNFNDIDDRRDLALEMARVVFGIPGADGEDDIPGAENLPVGNQLRDAVSSSQANNEEARQELRRALFTWEEFVKSAGSVMERISRIIENFARGVKGQ